jgi:hypothetical protein
MVAIIALFKDTAGIDAAPGTSTNTDALGPPMVKLKTADNPTIDNINVVPIPAAGTNYSFVNSLFFKCTFAPDTQIDNFQLYSDGVGFGTGITTYIGNQFPNHNSGSTSGYKLATGTIGTTGTEMTVNYPGITTKTDLFSFIVSAPESGPTISEAGSIINAADETTNYFVLQANVTNTATSGNKTNEDITCLYDEI